MLLNIPTNIKYLSGAVSIYDFRYIAKICLHIIPLVIYYIHNSKHKQTSGDFEWTAMVYNLNSGKNDDLLEKCRPLKEYMIFINKVREYSEDDDTDIKAAVTQAVDYCIDKNIMSDFLIKHKAEVVSMCITEFDEKIYEAELRRESREEGRETERAVNILTTISILKDLNQEDATIIKQISERFKITPEQSQEYLEKYYNELDKCNS